MSLDSLEIVVASSGLLRVGNLRKPVDLGRSGYHAGVIERHFSLGHCEA